MSVFYTDFRWNGQEYWLKYNFEAMKTLEEKLPEVDYIKEIVGNYAENVDLVCTVAAELMAQGENIRRNWGYPVRRIPTSEDLKLISTPSDLVELVVALIKELIHGSGRTDAVDSAAEYDPWLEESEKKKNFLASRNGR